MMVGTIWKMSSLSTLCLFVGNAYVDGWIRGVHLNGGDLKVGLGNVTSKPAVPEVGQHRHSVLQSLSKDVSSVEISSDGKIVVGSKVGLASAASETGLHDVIELRLWHSLQDVSKGMSPILSILALTIVIAIACVGTLLSRGDYRISVEQLFNRSLAAREFVTFSFKVRNVDYEQLSANDTLRLQFRAALENAIIEQVGSQLTREHLEITLSGGSVDVHVFVRPPHDVAAASLHSQLMPESTFATILKHVSDVSGIDEVKTGDIDSVWIHAPSVTNSMSTSRGEVAASSNRRTTEKEKNVKEEQRDRTVLERQRGNPQERHDENPDHQVGDRILTLNGEEIDGIVRYVGNTDFADGTWIGIELHEPCGKNDGSVNGKRYFECAPNHGVFVRKQLVKTTRGWNTVRSVVKTIGAFRAATRNK